MQPEISVLLFGLAGAALVLSGIGNKSLQNLSLVETATPQWRSWEKWFLAAVVLFGGLSRGYRLGSIPAGANGAEGQIAGAVHRLGVTPRYVAHWFGDINFPTLTYYQSLLSMKIFGEGAGALRLPSVFWGVLLLVLFYLLARRIASPESALIGTLLLSADQYTFLMSRMIFPGIITMVAPVGGFYFLLKGMKSQRLFDFAVGGALAGLSLHSYVPGRLFAALIICWILWLLVTGPRRVIVSIKGLGLYALMFVLIGAPVIHFAITSSESYWRVVQRVNPQAVHDFGHNFDFWLGRAKSMMKMFHYRGDPDLSMQIPGEPILNPIAGFFLPMGFVCCLVYFWRAVPAYLLGALVTGFLPAILAEGFYPPVSRRAVAVFPIVYLMIVMAIEFFRQGLNPWKGKWTNRLLMAIGVAAGFWAMAFGYNNYFERWANNGKVLYHLSHHYYQAGNIMRRNPDSKIHLNVYLNVESLPVSSIYFPYGRRKVPHREFEEIWRLDTKTDHLVFLDPLFEPDLHLIEASFPGFTMEKRHERRLRYQPAANLLALNLTKQVLKEARGVSAGQVGEDPIHFQLENLGTFFRNHSGQTIDIRFMMLLPRTQLSLRIDTMWPDSKLFVDGRIWEKNQKATFDGGPHFFHFTGRVPRETLGQFPLDIQLLEGVRGGWFSKDSIFPILEPRGVRLEWYKGGNFDVPEPNYSRMISVPRYRFFDIPFEPLHMIFAVQGKAWIHPQEEGWFSMKAADNQDIVIEIDGKKVYESTPNQPPTSRFFHLKPGQRRKMVFRHVVHPVHLFQRTFELSWIQKDVGVPEPLPASWLKPVMEGSWEPWDENRSQAAGSNGIR